MAGVKRNSKPLTRSRILVDSTSKRCNINNNKKETAINIGAWKEDEKIEFLRGLKKYGPRKWMAIASHIPTRTIIQVKSRGHHLLKKYKSVEGVLSTEDGLFLEEELPLSPLSTPYHKKKRIQSEQRDLQSLANKDEIKSTSWCQINTLEKNETFLGLTPSSNSQHYRQLYKSSDVKDWVHFIRTPET